MEGLRQKKKPAQPKSRMGTSKLNPRLTHHLHSSSCLQL